MKNQLNLQTVNQKNVEPKTSVMYSKHFNRNSQPLLNVTNVAIFRSLYKRKFKKYTKSLKFRRFRKTGKSKKPLKTRFLNSTLRNLRTNFTLTKKSRLIKELFLLKRRKAFLLNSTAENVNFVAAWSQMAKFSVQKQIKHTKQRLAKKRRSKKSRRKHSSWTLQSSKTIVKKIKNKKNKVKRLLTLIRNRKILKWKSSKKLNKQLTTFNYNLILSQTLKSQKVFNFAPNKASYLPKLNFKSTTFSTNKKRLLIQLHVKSKRFNTQTKKHFNVSYRKYWKRLSLTKKPYFSRVLPIYQNHFHSSTSFTANKKFLTLNPNKINFNLNQSYFIPLLKLTSQIPSCKSHRLYNYVHQYSTPNSVKVTNVQDVTYKNQLNSIITTKLFKVRGTFTKTLQSSVQNTSVVLLDKDIYEHTASQRLPELLSQWLYENNFIYPENPVSKKTTYVLSRVPNYKMVPNSPVSADKFRGNMYKRLGILRSSDLTFTPSNNALLGKFNYLYNLNSFSRTLKPKNIKWILNKRYLKKSQTKIEEISKIFYVKTKVTRLFEQTLKKKINLLNHSISKIKTPTKKHKREKLTKIKNIQLLSKNSKVRIHRANFSYQKVSRYSTRRQLKQFKSRLKKRWLLLLLKKKKSKKRTFFKTWNDLSHFVKTQFTKNLNTVTDFKNLNSRRRKFLKKLTKPNSLVHNTNRNSLPIFQKYSGVGNTQKKAFSNLGSQLNLPKYVNSSVVSKSLYNQPQVLLATMSNMTLLKSSIITATPNSSGVTENNHGINVLQNSVINTITTNNIYTNLIPDAVFNKNLSKVVLNSFKNNFFQENVISWYHNTMIRFLEDCTGKKILFQFYPFMSQDIDLDFIVRYKRWLPRMVFYERRLGHRFFLEEALHIIHLSFYLKDPKIICSWLKAMILRISFWKTRSIFRFLKYLFFNYFQHVFSDLKVKGLKIRLKGKISAAGNSRKRTILYRIGKTSHSTTSLRVLNESTTINTFTGVMGFNVWIFY